MRRTPDLEDGSQRSAHSSDLIRRTKTNSSGSTFVFSPRGRLRYTVVSNGLLNKIEGVSSYVREANGGHGMVRLWCAKHCEPVCVLHVLHCVHALCLQGCVIFGARLNTGQVKNVMRAIITVFTYILANTTSTDDGSSSNWTLDIDLCDRSLFTCRFWCTQFSVTRTSFEEPVHTNRQTCIDSLFDVVVNTLDALLGTPNSHRTSWWW